MTLSDFAVIGSEGVYLSSGGRLARPQFQQLPYWLDAMTRRNIETLWLHPSAGWRWNDNDITECDPWTVAGSGGDTQGEPWWTATTPGIYGVRDIVQPRWEDRAPWRDTPDAPQLRDALLAFRASVGIDWRRSPGATGTRLLRALHSGPHATRLELPGDPPPPAIEGLTRDTGHLYWTRAVSPDEQGYYLHSFDVNGQYLAACSSLALGVGQWVHHTRTELPEKPALWPAGYFKVKRAEKAKNGPYPPIVEEDAAPWVTTPTLRLLREQGAMLHIVESYTWAQSKRYLEPWYKTLREARTKCSDPTAREAIKGLYRHGIAWFESQKWDRSDDALYRPDWAQQVRAQARANVLRTVYRVGQNFDLWPLAVGSDCVYYLTPTPEPTGRHVTSVCMGATLPSDGLRLSPSLGHYKVKDAGVPFDEIGALVRGRSWSLAALQQYLNLRSGRRAA